MVGELKMDKITVDIKKLDARMKVLHDTNTKEVSFEFCINILVISSTFEVSKLDTSNTLKAER